MRVGFIADVHDDVVRLREAFDLLERRGCDEVACLGDMVGYCTPFYGFLRSRNGHEVVSLIKEKCSKAVVGSHDLYAVRRVPKHKAGFDYPKNWYKLDYWRRNELAGGKVYLYEGNELSPLLTREDEEYIKGLPEYLVASFGAVKALLSHWIYPDFSGSMTSNPEKLGDYAEHLRFMERHNCILSIQGHDHERVLSFSPEEVRELPLGSTVELASEPQGFICPCVANGTFPNGVMVLDTDRMELARAALSLKWF